MSKVHTQQSIRAQQPKKKQKDKEKQQQHKDAPEGRRVVYKSVLDNPLRIEWPAVPLNVQNFVLAAFTDYLLDSGVATYNAERERRSRRSKAALRSASSKRSHSVKKRKPEDDLASRSPKRRKLEDSTSVSLPAVHTSPEHQSVSDAEPIMPLVPPPVLSHLTIGVNTLTKNLESYAQHLRERLSNPSHAMPPTDSQANHAPVHLIFACVADVDPPILLAHIPVLVATINAMVPLIPARVEKTVGAGAETTPTIIHLIPLAKTAENALCDAVGLRRASIFGIDTSTQTIQPLLTRLSPFLTSIPILRAPWLLTPLPLPNPIPPSSSEIPASTDQSSASPTPNTTPLLIPTHIKQLQTTAPKDLKASKEKKIKERKQAKARKAEKKMSGKQDEKANRKGKKGGSLGKEKVKKVGSDATIEKGVKDGDAKRG